MKLSWRLMSLVGLGCQFSLKVAEISEMEFPIVPKASLS